MVLGLGFCVSIGSGASGPAVTGSGYLAFVGESGASQDVFVIDVSRSTTTRLTRGLTDVDGPVWSPDGAQLAFAAKSGGTSAVFVVRSDGARLRRLVAGRSPSWSPDGKRIAFAASHIETIEPDGRNRRRVSQRSGNYWSLTWSPAPSPRS